MFLIIHKPPTCTYPLVADMLNNTANTLFYAIEVVNFQP